MKVCVWFLLMCYRDGSRHRIDELLIMEIFMRSLTGKLNK